MFSYEYVGYSLSRLAGQTPSEAELLKYRFVFCVLLDICHLHAGRMHTKHRCSSGLILKDTLSKRSSLRTVNIVSLCLRFM